MKNDSNSLGTIISGFQGPELIIIGSRPEQGKTWLTLTIAKHMVYTYINWNVFRNILARIKSNQNGSWMFEKK